ncbi:hypothetical protein [Flexibacter flexilis]|nr:hypothetical protein [Flexibacter flexilis]
MIFLIKQFSTLKFKETMKKFVLMLALAVACSSSIAYAQNDEKKQEDRPKKEHAKKDGEKPKDGKAPKDGEKPKDGKAPKNGEKPKDSKRPSKKDGEKPKDGEQKPAESTEAN